MAARRKQEERSLTLLRQLLMLPCNKTCLDCGQRGPTYVNMTVGSFVCTSCSGRLRGLTPPHRVKSISMASFNTDEVNFVKQRGNEWCRMVWLGLYDASRHPDLDAKDDQQIKDFMVVKYEKKRYYVEPSAALLRDQQRPSPSAGGGGIPSSASSGSTGSADSGSQGAAVLPLQKLTGSLPLPALTLSADKGRTNGATLAAVPLARPPSNSSDAKHAPPQTQRCNVDLLADLTSSPALTSHHDPFSPIEGAVTSTLHNAKPTESVEFADFANFDAFNTLPAQPAFGVAAPLAPTAPLIHSAAIATVNSTASSSTAARETGDRYAALKELDDVLRTEVEPTVDWNTHTGLSSSKVSQQRKLSGQSQLGWAATPPTNTQPLQGAWGATTVSNSQSQLSWAATPPVNNHPPLAWGVAPASGNQSSTGWDTAPPPSNQSSTGWDTAPPPSNQSSTGWGIAPPPSNQSSTDWGTAPPPNSQSSTGWGTAPPPSNQSSTGWGTAPPPNSQSSTGWGTAPPPNSQWDALKSANNQSATGWGTGPPPNSGWDALKSAGSQSPPNSVGLGSAVWTPGTTASNGHSWAVQSSAPGQWQVSWGATPTANSQSEQFNWSAFPPPGSSTTPPANPFTSAATSSDNSTGVNSHNPFL